MQNAKNFEDHQNPFLQHESYITLKVLANLGAAYGTAKSGVGIANLGVRKSQPLRVIIANLDVLWRKELMGFQWWC